MSSGDIDNRLGSAEELERLRQSDSEFNSYLEWAWKDIRPIRTFFIPYGAGISEDLRRVYISYDLQTVIDGIECVSALIRHETVEAALRCYLSIGLDYLSDPRGHRLGNRAEHDWVNILLNRADGWELYSEIIDEQIILEERTNVKGRPIPLDLSLYPYEEKLYDNLKAEMYNDRSREEWARLRDNKP